jgi:hypothetical protein
MPMHSPQPNSGLGWVANDGARFSTFGAASAHERMMEPPRIHHPPPVHHSDPEYKPRHIIPYGSAWRPTVRSRSRPTQRSRGHALGVIVRIVIWAIVLVYVLPDILRPTPQAILNARKFVSEGVKGAAELAPPDVARSVDQVVNAISR